MNLALALPASAQGVASVPEPGGLTLLALGVAGVLIGRIAASKRPPD